MTNEDAIAALQTALEHADQQVTPEKVFAELAAIRAAVRKVKDPLRRWLQNVLNASSGIDFCENREAVVEAAKAIEKELGVDLVLSGQGPVRLRFIKPKGSSGLVQARTSDQEQITVHSGHEFPPLEAVAREQ